MFVANAYSRLLPKAVLKTATTRAGEIKPDDAVGNPPDKAPE
jgi:hypothetical protein